MLREYAGTARTTALSSGISAAAMSISVADGTGYPTGAAPFVITINAGGASEEKVLCASRTGNTISVTTRGWDDTTASDHEVGESVQHTFSATDAREANEHVNDSTGDPHPQYLTATEGNALFLTQAEGDALYAAIDVGASGYINVKDAPYNAAGDGVTNDTAAVQAALSVAGAKTVYFPPGTYMVNNLTCSVERTTLAGSGTLKKNANGPLLTLSANYITAVPPLVFDGNGGTYTGAGVVFAALCYRCSFDVHIDACSGPCYDFSGGAGYGTAARISGFARRSTPTSAAIVMPATEITGDRQLTNVVCGGGVLVDLAGSSTTQITACNTAGITFGAASVKAALVGNRIAGAVTIAGGDHTVTGNVFAGDIEITAQNSIFVANRVDGGITDSGTANQVANNVYIF